MSSGDEDPPPSNGGDEGVMSTFNRLAFGKSDGLRKKARAAWRAYWLVRMTGPIRRPLFMVPTMAALLTGLVLWQSSFVIPVSLGITAGPIWWAIIGALLFATVWGPIGLSLMPTYTLRESAHDVFRDPRTVPLIRLHEAHTLSDKDRPGFNVRVARAKRRGVTEDMAREYVARRRGVNRLREEIESMEESLAEAPLGTITSYVGDGQELLDRVDDIARMIDEPDMFPQITDEVSKMIASLDAASRQITDESKDT